MEGFVLSFSTGYNIQSRNLLPAYEVIMQKGNAA